ncbi:uncharacterized protein BO87DRAFT_411072 [Aspergillus neoniger CBS 115656]|uniref:Uncharacterized protein n=1 Tax=Aspergillus neoniger (strain CBS 115656) TaxID=1448310 RepID=A0A318Y4F4_ASPNB|nr:hypothetical protein BO87DRAFT_411072 [Aspergillus neoniger CBS 115656]PYH28699.1 hypothetical protein BO87DRAFT_411072 [Aspergillus neoniger CBS 115656]
MVCLRMTILQLYGSSLWAFFETAPTRSVRHSLRRLCPRCSVPDFPVHAVWPMVPSFLGDNVTNFKKSTLPPCDHEVVKRVVHWAVDLHHALRAAASRHQPAPISPWGVKPDFCSQALPSLISFSRAGAVMIDWRISLGKKGRKKSFLCILDKKYTLGL